MKGFGKEISNENFLEINEYFFKFFPNASKKTEMTLYHVNYV